MVIDGGGSLRRALLGDIIFSNALTNGWVGFVIYGSNRDLDELGAMDLGVHALAIYPMKTEKKGISDVDIPVTFAGVTIHPGDFIACATTELLYHLSLSTFKISTLKIQKPPAPIVPGFFY